MQSRIASVALVALLAGCGGSSAPQTDADAVAQVLKDAASAVANRDGSKACGYLTPDAQRQAELQVASGALGLLDCPTFIDRAIAFLTPLDKTQIESLEPSNIQVSGTSASATLASQAGAAPGQGISIQMNLQKVGSDWKISGFTNATGLPGA